MVRKEQHDRVLGYIDRGIRDGGEVLSGGGRHGNKGYFVQPTIFKNCGSESTLYMEEIFGSVLVAKSFKDADELIDPALPFGGFEPSGFGREQAADGVKLYTETKSVVMRI